MNDSLEQSLQALPLAQPSAELDRRMAAIFTSARLQRPRTPLPGWSLAALSLMGAAAALLLLPRPPAAASGPVYHVEARGALLQLLLEPPARRANPLTLTVRISTD